MAKVPVLTFDIGAVGERVKKDNLGWVIDFNVNSSIILEKIKEISNNNEEYKNKKDNFKNYKYKLLEEMQEYYKNMYEQIKAKKQFAEIYKFMNYRSTTKEFEFNEYQTMYGHVVYKYEKMRKTWAWKLAKKIKAKLK